MKRLLVGLGLPAAIVAIAGVPASLWWSRLPDEIAVHWTAGGHPNGHLSRAVGLGWPVGLAVLAAVLVAATALASRATAAVHVTALAAFFGGLFAAIALATVLVNRNEARWQDATLPLGAVALTPAGAVAAAVAVIVGLRPRWLRPLAREDDGSATGGGDRVAWVGGCHSSWVLAAAAAVVVGAGVTAARSGALFVAAMLSALGVLIALFLGSVRVVVGANGVRVTPGTGWPRVTIPLASIERVAAITLNPLEWGGWGYRGSLRLVGRAAWVLRRGEALRLDLTDGRTFAVTVDDAAGAAGVLDEWLARRRPAGSSA